MTILFIFVLAVAAAALLYAVMKLLSSQKKSAELEAELRDQKTQCDAEIKRWAEHSGALESANQRLAKWEGIADADAKAAEILQQAQAVMDKATSDAAQLAASTQEQTVAHRTTAQNEANAISASAKEEAKTLKDLAQRELSTATHNSALIVEAANKKAAEIAGSAYEAMKNASLYEQTVKAMKNLIEGYGDQYLVPAHSLLDDLAEDFGHTEAGQELKSSRERTKVMIRNGTAAKCMYVEANRRDTAVNFVIDAFNGRVDSILSRVRHDNVGTLEREIRDAFTLVNFNGKAFRDARVTDEFLSARLDELKWAAIAQQLKLEEREEQRRIKEQIREEEKARREYERAIRDAARDEELIRKAMDKARQQIEQANVEQKAKYEQQLRELSQKLQEAEERNQRALSMAQQTKRGHVYVISNIGSFGEHVYKIGLTRRLDPIDRVRELGDSSVPFEFDVHAMIFSEDAPALENQLHRHFVMLQVNKVNYRKEFFRVDLAHIHEEIEKLGISSKWTMLAEAREYHESLAIEKAITDDPSKRAAWIKRQLVLEPAEFEVLEPAEVVENGSREGI